MLSSQIATRPPTVAVFCNNPKLFGDNYKRYLDRKFREQVGVSFHRSRWFQASFLALASFFFLSWESKRSSARDGGIRKHVGGLGEHFVYPSV